MNAQNTAKAASGRTPLQEAILHDLTAFPPAPACYDPEENLDHLKTILHLLNGCHGDHGGYSIGTDSIAWGISMAHDMAEKAQEDALATWEHSKKVLATIEQRLAALEAANPGLNIRLSEEVKPCK